MKAYFDTYEEFLKENLPRLSVHFTKCGLTADLYLIDWWAVLLTLLMLLQLISCQITVSVYFDSA